MRRIKEQRGQVVIMFAFLIQAMFVFALIIYYLSQVSAIRIRLQSAADACALAMANFQARALNVVADRNYLLKYPSGTEGLVFPEYSFPGIHECNYPNYTFSSETIFNTYMQLISPQQDFQDLAVSIYDGLIPLVCNDFIVKNDYKRSDADSPIYLVNGYIESFDFSRQQIEVRYVEWVSGPGGGIIQHRESIDGWLSGGNKNLYSEVELAKVINILGQDVRLDAIARAEVMPGSGQVWPVPRPTYRARLVVTNKDGVLH